MLAIEGGEVLWCRMAAGERGSRGGRWCWLAAARGEERQREREAPWKGSSLREGRWGKSPVACCVRGEKQRRSGSGEGRG